MCGRLLSDFLGDSVGCDVHLEQVEGLQMKDAIRFKEVGLHNYLDFLFRTYHCYEASHRIIINLTGGFKGVIPYSTVAAMLLGLPIVYVFEFSDELIYLPPCPLVLIQCGTRNAWSVSHYWKKVRLMKLSSLKACPCRNVKRWGWSWIARKVKSVFRQSGDWFGRGSGGTSRRRRETKPYQDRTIRLPPLDTRVVEQSPVIDCEP